MPLYKNYQIYGNHFTEHGCYHPGEFSYMEEENQQIVLEAKTVYLLLPKNVPVSRAARLQWLLNHLNSVITIPIMQKSVSCRRHVKCISRLSHCEFLSQYLPLTRGLHWPLINFKIAQLHLKIHTKFSFFQLICRIAKEICISVFVKE